MWLAGRGFQNLASTVAYNVSHRPACYVSCLKYNTSFVRWTQSSASRSASDLKPFRVAIIGSGPAGFYTAQALLKRPNVHVDIYEKFPVPFGLIRFGVAPDHPDVKNVIHSFTETALKDRVSFFGNVAVGEDVKLDQIRSAYHATVFCYGAAADKRLNIPGEDSGNVLSARCFVGWYNGVPADRDLAPDLTRSDTAIIIGHGNVALDCARILLEPPDEVLKSTDITEHALAALRSSRIRRVLIVGRRGPGQVSFTIREFREMTKIHGCHTRISPDFMTHLTAENLSQLARPRKRLTELMLKISQTPPPPPPPRVSTVDISRNCEVEFLRSPTEIIVDNSGHATGVKFAINRLAGDPLDVSCPVEVTDETETVDGSLVLRSIGYRTILIDPSLPFDSSRGTIANHDGRVTGAGMEGLYCSGWAATGATGVILSTMSASFEVAKRILADWDHHQTADRGLDVRMGSDVVIPSLESNGVQVVHFQDWQRIDEWETRLGLAAGKPREKLIDIQRMIEIARRPI